MSGNPEAPLLLCYDGSDGSKHAIESAAGLLKGHSALVLTVWQPTDAVGSFAWSGATAGMVDFLALDRAAAEDGARIAAEGALVAKDAGLDAEPIAERAPGPVWTTICEVAERRGVAAIVIGSRGLSGVRSLLLGSVSGAVVHNSDRPTLVVGPAHRD